MATTNKKMLALFLIEYVSDIVLYIDNNRVNLKRQTMKMPMTLQKMSDWYGKMQRHTTCQEVTYIWRQKLSTHVCISYFVFCIGIGSCLIRLVILFILAQCVSCKIPTKQNKTTKQQIK